MGDKMEVQEGFAATFFCCLFGGVGTPGLFGIMEGGRRLELQSAAETGRGQGCGR